jgi:hypothetical protein
MTNRDFQDRVRAFSALYPIPIIFSALLVFALCCLSLAAFVVGPFSWVLAGIGVVTVLSASVLVGYVVVYKSELLRVERESITVRWIDPV